MFTSIMVCVWVVLPASNQTPKFSVGKFHASLTQRMGGSMVFFNQEVPYMGSIISFAGDESVKETGYDFYGIYFRTIYHAKKRTWDQWTFIISLWYPIILFGILPAIFAVKKLRAKISR
jgi:hypothetical protein